MFLLMKRDQNHSTLKNAYSVALVIINVNFEKIYISIPDPTLTTDVSTTGAIPGEQSTAAVPTPPTAETAQTSKVSHNNNNTSSIKLSSKGSKKNRAKIDKENSKEHTTSSSQPSSSSSQQQQQHQQHGSSCLLYTSDAADE